MAYHTSAPSKPSIPYTWYFDFFGPSPCLPSPTYALPFVSPPFPPLHYASLSCMCMCCVCVSVLIAVVRRQCGNCCAVVCPVCVCVCVCVCVRVRCVYLCSSAMWPVLLAGRIFRM